MCIKGIRCFYEHRKFKSSCYGRINSVESFRLAKKRQKSIAKIVGLELANYIAVLLDPMSLKVPSNIFTLQS